MRPRELKTTCCTGLVAVLFLTAGLVAVLFLTGCATVSGQSREKERELWAQYGEENARQHQALGERVYDKNFDLVFTAIVTAFADMGFSVKNMERQSGYILAEGPSPLPPDQEVALIQPMIDELNRVSPQTWTAQPGNSTQAVTITILKLGKGNTKVKMRCVTIGVSGNYSTVYHAIYPPLLQAYYQTLWRGLEKQIFLDENLDKANR